MQTIYLANTDFEFELVYAKSFSIEEAWKRMPTCLQLQYLPLLFANKGDVIAVTSLPDEEFIAQFVKLTGKSSDELPSFIQLHDYVDLSGWQCLSWGFSKKVEKWAKERQAYYQMPDWSVVQQINSKFFSFQHSPQLPGSQLIWNEKDLQDWLKMFIGPKVLKTCFGLSGHGHFIIQAEALLSSIQAFCLKEWKQQRPLIGEPWLERVLDFSTQWTLTPQGSLNYLGAAIFESSGRGTYLGTSAGPESLLFKNHYPSLLQHKQEAEKIIEIIASKGFYGSFGIDAFLYKDSNDEIRLRPIVEVNGRRTMSSAILQLQQKSFPNQVICCSYTQEGFSTNSLLPNKVQTTDGRLFSFNKKLILSIVP